MELVKIRIKRAGELQVNGQLRHFEQGQEVEVTEEEGRELIRKGLALPGLQYGQTIQN